MPILHVANTSFEQEIAASTPLPFPDTMESHPLYLQLQFLPFLYANQEDYVFTTVDPDEGFFQRLNKIGIVPPQMVHTPIEGAVVQSWGDSPSLSLWAQQHRLLYETPSWDIIRDVNSKAFSFANATRLKDAALIHNWDELKAWYNRVPGWKVLKTCFGVSGRGHFHLKNLDDPALVEFAQREWSLARPLIAEPWVERRLDFSTQWYLGKEGKPKYLGFTVCENDARGHYRGTVVGNPAQLLDNLFSHFTTHVEEVERLLSLIRLKGYFGHIGVDAMIYQERLLQPVVEINARKTMGWTAIALRNRYFPERSLRVFLSEHTRIMNPLLPFKITTADQRQITFQKQLCVEFVD